MRRQRTGLALAVLLTGCTGPDDHGHPRLETGEQFYRHHCAACHHDEGEGLFLRGIPPVRYTAMSYRELVGFIQGHGRDADTRMPEFVDMPRKEAEAIAVYIRQKLRLEKATPPK